MLGKVAQRVKGGPVSACTPKIGIWAALLSTLFAACFSIVALAANLTSMIPAIWVNPLSFAPSLLLAWSYLVLMACVLDAAPAGHRVWALLSLCFATIYAALNSFVYFVQLAVVTPLVFEGHGDLAGVLAFGPRSFMLSLNGLAYGGALRRSSLPSRFPADRKSSCAAPCGPTAPFALAGAFRRAGTAASHDSKHRPLPLQPGESVQPAWQRRPAPSMRVRAE